jgi:hypothetical protein
VSLGRGPAHPEQGRPAGLPDRLFINMVRTNASPEQLLRPLHGTYCSCVRRARKQSFTPPANPLQHTAPRKIPIRWVTNQPTQLSPEAPRTGSNHSIPIERR